MSSILVVDDSRFARRTMRALIEPLGHSVDEASSGAQALELYREKRHDIVTLDLLMPDMDGIAALKKLREINPHVRVVVATADVQETTRAEVLGFGGCAVVNKPVRQDELQQALGELLKVEAAWS